MQIKYMQVKNRPRLALTGRENLRHMPDANTKADALMERFDLLEDADRRVATYAGGMRSTHPNIDF